MRKRYNLYARDDAHIGTYTADEILAMVLSDSQSGSVMIGNDLYYVEED